MPSMQLKALLALLPFLALAQSETDSCEPSVDLANGTYVGVSNEHYAQEFFLGIPYAQPPTGSLRFASPKPLTEAFEEPRDATAYGNSCIGYGADTLGLDTPLSEDCLNLNVVRPEGTQPGDDLPVGVWVHGGSYVTGGSSDSRYNLSKIVDQSVQEGKPIIGVSINYRLSYWGFLFSEEMDAAGAGNVAFKDQRLAFQWIHDNIAAFGGSADKVTIWGESAGARSLGIQLIGYEGKYDNLFRSAILESGSPVAQFVGAEEWQPYFDYVVEKTNCSSANDHLDCLREVPWQALNAIFNGTTPSDVKIPFFSAVIDGDFITAQATELLAAGKFAHVPLLLGNNHDEGTAYGKQGINTTEQFQDYVASFSLNSSQVDELTTLYPDDPAVGIPPSYTGRPEAYPFGLQWKRVAAFAGDFQQHAGRRLLAETYAGAGLDVYSYIWNVYVNGIPAIRGATHFQEVAFVFNDVSSSEFDGKPETFVQLADLMSKMWVHFMHDTEPNYDDAYNATTWPKYTLDQPDNIVFDVNRTGLTYVEKDDYRKNEIAYLQTEVY